MDLGAWRSCLTNLLKFMDLNTDYMGLGYTYCGCNLPRFSKEFGSKLLVTMKN